MTAPPTEKPCTRCDETKPLEDFHACASAKDGKTRWCKACFIRHRKDQSAAIKAQRLARKAEREAEAEGRKRAKEASRALVARFGAFRVQKTACSTCIYRKDSTLDLAKLEADIADPHGGFNGYRICHHSEDVCCRGFWNRYANDFAAGQIAQRLGLVEFVSVDVLSGES